MSRLSAGQHRSLDLSRHSVFSPKFFLKKPSARSILLLVLSLWQFFHFVCWTRFSKESRFPLSIPVLWLRRSQGLFLGFAGPVGWCHAPWRACNFMTASHLALVHLSLMRPACGAAAAGWGHPSLRSPLGWEGGRGRERLTPPPPLSQQIFPWTGIWKCTNPGWNLPLRCEFLK